MVTTETTEWTRARAALDGAVGRVTALLRSLPNPATPALGDWNVGEVAMHLSQAWLAVPGLARNDRSEIFALLPELAGTAGESYVPDLWELAKTTMLLVEADPERDLGVIADRIEARAARYLAELDAYTGDERRPWLVDGSTGSMLMLTCHLLSETLTHGYDIALASGRQWPIEAETAALLLNEFLLQVIRALPPDAMVMPGSTLDATFELRVRGSRSHHLVFDATGLRAEEPGSRRVDCHVSADPVAMLLLMWGRRPQWRAIARGQVLAWGRKPWLGPQLRAMIRNP